MTHSTKTHRTATAFALVAAIAVVFALAGCATTGKEQSSIPELTFNPAGGSYTAAQTVVIASAQSVVIALGDQTAKIYYTVDGSEPSAQNGKLYQKPVKVDKSQTIKAVAVPDSGKPGPVVSAKAVVSAKYVITGTVASPRTEKLKEVRIPSDSILIKLVTDTPEASARYTLDGSVPTKSYGMEYAGIPVKMDKGMTLKALAFRDGWKDSALLEESFDTIAARVTDQASATSLSVQTAAPVVSGTVGMTAGISARGASSGDRAASGLSAGSALAVSGALPIPSLQAPKFSPEPGMYPEPQTITLAGIPEGGSIRYSMDGSEPGPANGIAYSSPFRIEKTMIIRAVAIGADSRVSPAAGGEFVITGTVSSPVVSPAAGTYPADRTLSISSSTPGAVIRYTLDGSMPSSTKGQLYSGPIKAKGSVTLNAVAVKTGWKDSPATTMVFTFIDTPSMVFVQGSIYNMGSESGEADEKPAHPVTVSSFYIGAHEVTQAQYRSMMGSNPSRFKDGLEADSRPVEQVTWFNAIGYCNALSDLAGFPRVYTVMGTTVTADHSRQGYRLPTEAEWEFAARGGIAGTLSGAPVLKFAGSNDADQVSWNSRNSGESSKTVGAKVPNGLGLYDMTGNVWEWCGDWYSIYSAASGKPLIDPKGAATGTMKVKRGGSWNRLPDFSRVSFRNYHNPNNNDRTLGFRVARTVVR